YGRLHTLAEEAPADLDEAVGDVGDEETRAAAAPPPQQAGSLEGLAHLARRLFGRIDERDRVAEKLADCGLQKRIVRAAEDQRVDAAPAKASEIEGDRRPRDLVVGPSLLGERHEQRAGPRIDLEVGAKPL